MAPASNTTYAASSASTVAPFDHGLNGVDIAGDNDDSLVLYLLVGLVCIMIAVVRILQHGNNYLRKITSFTSTPEQQLYWTRNQTTWWPKIKNDFIYAPLVHKRHNNEIQLSAAVNMGTIPGRLHTALLASFLIVQVAFMLSVDWSQPDQAEVLAGVRGKSGHLAVINMVLLFLLAGRNNPFIWILRIPFDTFNLFHRWIGRMIVIESLVHTFAWLAVKVWASGWDSVNEALTQDAFIQYGFLALIVAAIILIQSPSAVRHAFYEIFLHLHQLLAFLFLLGVFFHAKLGDLPQMPYVIIVICLWVFDRSVRLGLLFYHNFSLTNGMTRATVEALPGEACRVTFHMPRDWTPWPGAHVYAYLPRVSFWQSHPFSVAWSQSSCTRELPLLLRRNSAASGSNRDSSAVSLEKAAAHLSSHQTPPQQQQHGSTVSLVMLARTGMTRQLYERALRRPNATLHCRALLEGPYGTPPAGLHSYGTVMLFAGGVGITHQLPLTRSLLQAHAEGCLAARRVTLVWSFRGVESLEWVRPFMDELLAAPNRREVLRILLFVTRPRSAREVVASASGRVQMFGGRANPRVLVRQEFERRAGAMCVGVCGPGVFADEVRAAAREVVPLGKVDFWEEGFTW